MLLEIAYDALSRRIQSTEHIDSAATGTPPALTQPKLTVHVYAGFEPIEEYDADTNGPGAPTVTLAREFVWGSTVSSLSPPALVGDGHSVPEPVAMIDHTDAGDIPATGTTGGSPEILHYLHDALGSVIGLTDASGTLVERYDYDPYGKTYVQDANANPRQVSHYGNPWMWTGQRFDGTTGQYHFTFRAYNPTTGRWLQRDPLGYWDSLNFYEYTVSDPLGWVDPYGLASWFQRYVLGTGDLVDEAVARNNAIADNARARGGTMNQALAADLDAHTARMEAGASAVEAHATQQVLATTVAAGAASITAGVAGAAATAYVGAGTAGAGVAESIFVGMASGAVGGATAGGVEAAIMGDDVASAMAVGGGVGMITGGVAGAAAGALGRQAANAQGGTPGTYRPGSPLPRGPNGEMMPSSSYPHTQLGTKTGRKVGPYTAAREFGEDGRWIRDIHFTDHGRGHPNPLQHRAIPNPTGGTPQRGGAEPCEF